MSREGNIPGFIFRDIYRVSICMWEIREYTLVLTSLLVSKYIVNLL